MRGKITGIVLLLLCAFAVMLSGCQFHISVGTNDTLTGETYPNAEKYHTGTFTYNAADIKAVEIYWRSGEVEITESDISELHVRESGGELPEDTAMHHFLDDGVLRIRFCKMVAQKSCIHQAAANCLQTVRMTVKATCMCLVKVRAILRSKPQAGISEFNKGELP